MWLVQLGNLFNSRVTIKFVKFKLSLFLLSFIAFGLFMLFSLTVAKEAWQQVDFNTMVKIQDRIPRKYDEILSYFSLIGSVEVTFGIVGILALVSLIRLKIFHFLGWIVIIPATVIEVFGKLVLFHPSTPVLFHRNALETDLPSFYVQTNFSYPSGHMTRTTFLVTAFILLILFSKQKFILKIFLIFILLSVIFMMALTRIYLGEHWLSDVIGGILLGLSAGLFAGVFTLGRKYVTV